MSAVKNWDIKFEAIKDCKKIIIVIFMCLVFMKYVLEISISKYILLAIYVLIMLLGDKAEIIAACVCCIPLFNVFNHYYATLVGIFVYVLRYYKDIKVVQGIIPVAMLWIWELLHFSCIGFTWKGCVTFILPYVLCLLLMYSKIKQIDYCKIVRILAACTLFICFVMFCRLIVDYELDLGQAFYDRHRLGMSLKEGYDYLNFNPNALGYFCLLAITGLVQLLAIKKGTLEDAIMILFLTVCGIMTMSKTFVLCMALLFFLIWYMQKGDWKTKVKTGIKAMGILVFIMIPVVLIFPGLFKSFWGRFFVGDVTSGRLQLFTQYMDYIFDSFQNFFFGTGVTGWKETLIQYYGESYVNVPHNGFQEIIVVWGVPGFAMFSIFLIFLLKRAKMINRGQKLINYIPIILLFVKVQLGQLVTSYYTMMMFVLCYLSLCYGFEEEEQVDPRIVKVYERIMKLMDKFGDKTKRLLNKVGRLKKQK